MKKATLTFGLISSILFIIGVLFKSQHWPGASAAMSLGIILFALGYAPLLFSDRNKLAENATQKTSNLVILIAMIIISISFLFKAMHWPGAGIGIGIGHLALIALVPVLFTRASKASDTKVRMDYNNEAIILLFVIGFSLFIWLVIGQN